MMHLILGGWMLAAALVVQAGNEPAPANTQNESSTEADDSTKADVVERIENAEEVFNEVMDIPENIPSDLLADAHCVGIIPRLVRGAFIVGAQYGKGVITCRDDTPLGWTAPSTVRVEGGSVGFQIGGSETDLFLLVMNEEGARRLMRTEFTLGADASVAAGPVGRELEAETDLVLSAGVLSYSRSRGAFAGVSLEGATLRADEEDNAALYGEGATHEEILMGNVMVPPEARSLLEALNMHSSGAVTTERDAVSDEEEEPALAPDDDDDEDIDIEDEDVDFDENDDLEVDDEDIDADLDDEE